MFPYTADKKWFILSFKLSNGFMFAVFQMIIKEYFSFVKMPKFPTNFNA